MAEYCSQCSPFENEFDMDLFRIAIKVKKGNSINLLCEGCNNKTIYRDEDGLIYLVKDENTEMKFYPIKLEEL